MYLLYSVNVYIFNVVIEIKFYSILFYKYPGTYLSDGMTLMGFDSFLQISLVVETLYF